MVTLPKKKKNTTELARKSILSNVLEREFSNCRSRSPRYSLRAFARRLKLQPATLSHVLNNRRSLPLTDAKRICKELKLHKDDEKKLLLEISGGMAEEVELDFYYPSEDDAAEMKHWHHWAILSLLELPGFSRTNENIAQKLGISIRKANVALKLFCKMGVVVCNDSEYSLQKIQGFKLPDSSRAARSQALQEYIELALPFIARQSTVDVSDCVEISGVTFVTNQARLKKAQDMIKNFRRALATYLTDTSNPDGVYRLNIQLFPARCIPSSTPPPPPQTPDRGKN